MKLSKICSTLLASVICAGTLTAQSENVEQPETSDLVETAERRLIQLDVSFDARRGAGDNAVVPPLQPQDFELFVNAGKIDIRHADRVCRLDERQVTSETVDVVEAQPEMTHVVAPLGTYIFYLEHKLLTMRGQNVAFEMVEDLVRDMVVDGNRGMIVSSGGTVMQSRFSTVPQELLDFLDEVRTTPKQWRESEYAQLEQSRVEDLLPDRHLTEGTRTVAAIAYKMEEMQTTTNRLHRLAALIGGLSEIDPPKAVFYFADIVRKEPGQHYASFLGRSGSLSQTVAFDKLLEESNAQGVRLYTIQAQGIQQPSRAGLGQSRIEEAENTLRSLSAETGGEMFFGGNEASTTRKILRSVERDFNCFYLLSFAADGLPQDGPLRVLLRLNPDTENGAAAERDYSLQTRGQLVVQSESRRKESMVLAAHLNSATIEDDVGRGGVIPLGFRGGKYEALVQFIVRSPELPPGILDDSQWDLGMTRLSGTDVTDNVSGRIGTNNPSAPVILETRWSFPPGELGVISVGHEQRLGQLATSQLNLEWPDPDKARLTVSPIAAVQPHDGAFLKKDDGQENSRIQGPVTLGDGVALVDRALALVGLVCRNKRMKDDLWVVRELTGDSTVEFPPIHWKFDGERCVHLRDVIKNGQMGWGDFVYDIKVFENEGMTGEPAVSRRRTFSAVELAESPASGPAS